MPVLIDAKRKVIAGHGRIMACKLLGWSEVPTIALEHLSEAQANAFMIADNRLTENSVWDDRLLAEQLKELSVLDLEFSLEATGFEMGEIDFRIERLTSSGQSEDAADDLSAIPQGPIVTRPGDLWLMGSTGPMWKRPGPERLCCADGARQAGLVFSILRTTCASMAT